MKVAIVFDFFEGIAGAEKTTRILAEKYNADVYTGYVNWDRTYPETKKLKITTLGTIPKIPLIKQEVLVRKFRALDLSNYDAIISLGFYSLYTAIKNHPTIWYAYGVSPLFYKKGDVQLKQSLLWKIGAQIWKKRIQNYDKSTIQNSVDEVVTISQYSRSVVNAYYERDSSIVEPFVNTKTYHYNPPEDYYLIVSRLEPGKRVELVVDAFKKMPDKNLLVVGKGTLLNYLMNSAKNSPNIEFLHSLNNKELSEAYSKCIAFIGTAYFDDWSMPMVEAMASGKPAIGVNQGAYPEIINGKTGLLVDGTPDGIVEAVRCITPEIAIDMKDDCMARANEWNLTNFYRKWDKILKKYK